MTAPIPVFINGGGGAAKAKGDALRGEVEAAFAKAGVTIDVQILEGGALQQAVTAHVTSPLVVVGGGDGTLSCAAQAILDHGGDKGAALGILPLGTLNHLAKELAIPLELVEAAALIAKRPTRRIDVARVNGRVFLNNASVGMYPLMVREREQQQRGGLPKWLATLPAVHAALRRLPRHRLHIRLPDERHDIVTPLLFVGNNRYELDMGRVGQRAAMNEGVLSIFAVASRRRLALIGFALRMLIGKADRDQDFAAIGETASFTVGNRSSHLDVALDGEVETLRIPLEFSIQPRALTVVAPLERGQALA